MKKCRGTVKLYETALTIYPANEHCIKIISLCHDFIRRVSD
jgi:hypothetical protein